jgi:two-component system catabolic regulation response regulator CreB
MPHILIVEDETTIADTLVFALNSENLTTHHVLLGSEALRYAAGHGVDLVIMDVGLPDMTGFETCKRLRQTSDVPVLFLTARSDEIDRIVGLEIGGDDYVTKPFSAREVAARVKAILKRTSLRSMPAGEPSRQPGDVTTSSADVSAEFHIDETRHLITFRGQSLGLTRLEYHLLNRLVASPGTVLSRDTLMDALGISRQAGYDRNIDSHIKSLRSKLRAIAPEADPIQTQRGFGYFYRPES